MASRGFKHIGKSLRGNFDNAGANRANKLKAKVVFLSMFKKKDTMALNNKVKRQIDFSKMDSLLMDWICLTILISFLAIYGTMVFKLMMLVLKSFLEILAPL